MDNMLYLRSHYTKGMMRLVLDSDSGPDDQPECRENAPGTIKPTQRCPHR